MNLKLVLWLLLPFVLCRLPFLCLSCSMFWNHIGQRLNAGSSKSMSVSIAWREEELLDLDITTSTESIVETTCNTIYSHFKTREGTLSVSDTSETTDPSLRLCFLFTHYFWAADLWLCFPLTWFPCSDDWRVLDCGMFCILCITFSWFMLLPPLAWGWMATAEVIVEAFPKETLYRSLKTVVSWTKKVKCEPVDPNCNRPSPSRLEWLEWQTPWVYIYCPSLLCSLNKWGSC